MVAGVSNDMHTAQVQSNKNFESKILILFIQQFKYIFMLLKYHLSETVFLSTYNICLC